MKSPYTKILNEITALLENALKDCGYSCDVAPTIDVSRGFGDIASTCALKIAKQMSLSAVDVAGKIAAKLQKGRYIENVTTENGFVNIKLNRDEVSGLLMSTIRAEREAYIRSGIGAGKRTISEYISANPIHPLHVGQVRSALLGDVVSNLYWACGYTVERENYIDDLGRQAAQVVWGSAHLELIGVGQQSGEKYDHYLGKIYVAVNEYARSHDIENEISNTILLMEQDGTYESKFLGEMVEQFINAEYATAFGLGVYQDVLVWESDIVRNKLLEKSMEMLDKKGVAKKVSDGKYAGCTVIDFKDVKDLPQEFLNLKEDMKVLIRSNGTPNYVAKDIAFHLWKFGLLPNTFRYKEFIHAQPNGKPLYTTAQEGEPMDFGNADITINSIDVRQSYEQSLVKLSLDALGYPDKAAGFRHLSYGVVELEGSVALAGRKGTWQGYTADDLVREAQEKAKTLIGTRFQLGEDEREKIAKDVAVAAIRFEFLKLSQEKKLVFSWERALNFEGASGPYCQYMFARAARILESAGAIETNPGSKISLPSEIEFSVVKLLTRAQNVVEKACIETKPNVIIDYITDLAVEFAKFYEQKPVLKAESETERSSRLALVGAFKLVMDSMLRICGITPIERM
ncbi:MAG: arginine--tRNA ligase [Candidatus Marsarchaeota archaeon]|nr:arginine--tRNA ligase [Candidatus Marsarchaeota archaeon]